MGELHALRFLSLEHNQLTGTIPAALGNLSTLGWLRLQGNQLSGPVPASLGELRSLRELRLDDNQLRGAVAQRLGSLANLQLLYLGGNAGLNGCIPAALQDVPRGDLSGLGLASCEDPDPLTLSLIVGREECTAGTLNPVAWEIRGGAGPYRLTVDGASVDPDAERATVTCGAPSDGATEAPRTITVGVTDAAGRRAEATAAYTVVPPLPAVGATAVPYVRRLYVLIEWRGLTVPATCDVPTGCFAFRARLAGETSWEYTWDRHENAQSDWTPGIGRSVPAGTTVEAGIAAMRHPIEP